MNTKSILKCNTTCVTNVQAIHTSSPIILFEKKDTEFSRESKSTDNHSLFSSSLTSDKIQIEFQQQLVEKDRLEKRLAEVNEQIKELLNYKKEDSLCNDNQMLIFPTNQIIKLKNEFERREDEFKKKTKLHEQLKKEKEKAIKSYQAKHQKLLTNHTCQIDQLNASHTNYIHKLHREHEEELVKLKQFNKNEEGGNEKTKLIVLNNALEQLLKELDEENHDSSSIKPSLLKEGNSFLYQALSQRNMNSTSHSRKTHKQPINQHTYSQRYMPFDAISWLIPQQISNSIGKSFL
ncbi:uncharacterized protein BX663DRAFT_495251 [Cokeromyces recurvatus]|uniref:uncharacterized protein n=1 Tax=Cokeromyces recurvatus TaxID=90255 RepID=UPI00221EA67F|nr:uncharacterized protein BX663DRAFT_495251 [Cokeromyces recurvatus]KAI7907226.1 hypothetical protein BX663DRAFT_495251 [Cokeromyces recurvatus]